MKETLEILLEDGPCLAVEKPPGIATQGPPAATDTLVSRVKAYLKERYDKPGRVYLGVPHRLDRAVGGVVLFARNSKAAARLATQFRDRQVRKVYRAIVERVPDPPEGTLDDWIEKLPDQPLARIVENEGGAAKRASLRYRILQVTQRGALLEVEPRTGRFHQIRVQLAHRGWPVLGDRLYGATKPFIEPSASGDAAAPETETAIALHARSLTFLHPIRYDSVTVTSPTPEKWPFADHEPFS